MFEIVQQCCKGAVKFIQLFDVKIEVFRMRVIAIVSDFHARGAFFQHGSGQQAVSSEWVGAVPDEVIVVLLFKQLFSGHQLARLSERRVIGVNQ